MSTTQTLTDIRIPTPLRAYTNNQTTIAVTGETVGEALTDLVAQYPRLQPHLYDDQGALRSFVNIYRNDEDIRYLDKTDTRLGANDELSIVPSIAGGIGR